MDLIEGIKSRRSIREFKKEAVPRDILTSIFTIASWAPNHHQKEPWKLYVYEKQEVNRLADKIIASYARMDYIKDTSAERETMKNIKNFITAIPHHVLVFLKNMNRKEYMKKILLLFVLLSKMPS